MDYASAYGSDDYGAENSYFYDDEATGAVTFPTASRNVSLFSYIASLSIFRILFE
jgi:hypothetical protein